MKESFFEQVYDLVTQIPFGQVASYGQIAKLLNRPNHSRQVGFALHANPDPANIPCHRVVNRKGQITSGFAFGGANEHRKRLEAEGVVFLPNGTIDMSTYQWELGKEL